MNGSIWPLNSTPIHRRMPDAAKILAFGGASSPAPTAHDAGHNIK